MIAEKIRLLGGNVYKDIPAELTLKALPTISELDYVGSEDFEETMINKILPAAVEEKIDFTQLLEIDFYWICRCLRILNYGPYHSTNAIFCPKCGMSYGDYIVNLNTIGCKDLPEGFVNDLLISGDEFIDFEGDIRIRLLTIKDMMTAYKDKGFLNSQGRVDKELARACYMITSIDGKPSLAPIEKKMYIQNHLSSADYIVLKERINSLTDYGLRAGGQVQCPKCGGGDASYYALVDDKFFRVSISALREWKLRRSERAKENVSGNKKTEV